MFMKKDRAFHGRRSLHCLWAGATVSDPIRCETVEVSVLFFFFRTMFFFNHRDYLVLFTSAYDRSSSI